MEKKAGVIGCGAMGRGIVKNLLLNGYQVFAYDVSAEALDLVKELGATPVDEQKEVFSEVNYLIMSLPSSELVEETVTGENGALAWMKRGSFILDVSTTNVDTTRRIFEQANEKEISFFDCPLSGGPEGADKGELTIVVGGDPNRYDAVFPVLNAIGKEIEYIGESGAGQVIKLCNNIVVAGIITLLSEAFLTGVKAGVPVDKIAAMMQKGSAQNKAMTIFGPNLLTGDHENVKFMLQHMSKDINLYMDLAKQEEIPTFFSAATEQFFTIAKNSGKGGLDTSAVSQVLEELAGVSIVPK